jgi:D-3-phosphoglycerate dehydrogenase
MQRHRILICEPLGQEGLSILNGHADFSVDVMLDLKADELRNRIADYDALLVRSQTKVNSEIINAGRNLKLIGRAGVGTDNIDLACAEKNGVAVINTPTGNSISTAEFAFALLINLARNVSFAHKSLASGQWLRSKYAGMEICHKTLGIIGFGNVGRQLSLRAKAFNMNVVAFDPVVENEVMNEFGAKKLELFEVLGGSDFISLHCGLNSHTKQFINKDSVAKIKKGAMLINTARGELVDSKALLEALDSGHLAAAAIDVFSVEPPEMSEPLFKHPQVLFTPHLGASTKEAQTRVASLLAEHTIAFFTKSNINILNRVA